MKQKIDELKLRLTVALLRYTYRRYERIAMHATDKHAKINFEKGADCLKASVGFIITGHLRED